MATLLMFLGTCAAAQNAVQVQRLEVLRDRSDVRVEVTLNGDTNPSVETAIHPDRIILVLPNTISDAKQQRAVVGANGVRSVRMGLNSVNPPVTRVVVDLDRPHPYTLGSQGSRIVLTIQPSGASSSSAHRSGPPAAASFGSLGGIFHRRSSKNSGNTSDANASGAGGLPTPPPAFPPINFPAQSAGSGTSASAGTHSAPALTQAATPSQSAADQTLPNAVVPSASQPTTVSEANFPKAQLSVSVAQPQPNQQLVQTPKASGPAPASEASAPAVPSTTTQPSVALLSQPATKASEPDLPKLALRAVNSDLRTAFKVKYVAQGAAYLDGGRSSGLAEGMKLVVRDNTSVPGGSKPDAANPATPVANDGTVAELEVISVAETSAVTDIRVPTRDVKPGDIAYLSSADQEALVQKNALSATRKYPTVISFTEGDTLDEEARDEVPKPPLPSVNRARGAIGFDYMGTMTHGAGGGLSSDLGMMVRTDITRIRGTYWNMSGYWRGRLEQQSAPSQPTLQDLINRTYHLAMTYDNPQSAWVAGFGRLYLPWASSLDTIDGGYFGRRSHGVTTGIFAGSTPDPTSWDYNPQQRIAGSFVNFEGGSFDDFRYTSTTGLGVSTLNWQVTKPFVFAENGLYYKRFLSIYDSMQADSPRGTPATPAPGPGLGRSFLTVRVQPISRLELDFNHTYFRDVPTFDPTLIGTGLLDKYLFQGFSAGARVEVVKHIWVYSDLGRSNRTGDAKSSLNQLYGVTWDRLPWFGLRADAHYSRFNSAFADGRYESFSLSRNFGDFRLQLLVGQQDFTSTLSANNRSRFITSNVEAPLGTHYFLQGGFTTNRGGLMNYDQWMFTMGYRFDSRQRHGDR